MALVHAQNIIVMRWSSTNRPVDTVPILLTCAYLLHLLLFSRQTNRAVAAHGAEPEQRRRVIVGCRYLLRVGPTIESYRYVRRHE